MYDGSALALAERHGHGVGLNRGRTFAGRGNRGRHLVLAGRDVFDDVMAALIGACLVPGKTVVLAGRVGSSSNLHAQRLVLIIVRHRALKLRDARADYDFESKNIDEDKRFLRPPISTKALCPFSSAH